jgi:hypothetical protein
MRVRIKSVKKRWKQQEKNQEEAYAKVPTALGIGKAKEKLLR